MEKAVISLGGSVIVPDGVDWRFIREFRELITGFTARKNKVAIFCGGGSVARKYQNALEKIIGHDQAALDWMGISATRLNAFLMRCVFSHIAEPQIVSDPTKPVMFRKRVLVCSGWKPGWSTDYDAVLLGQRIGAKKIINMTNVDAVYDSDPRINRKAKRLSRIAWKDFRKLVGDTWKPGLNMPFDPIASKEAEKNNMAVHIIGKDIKNLGAVLEGKDFSGTLIGG